MTYLFFLVHHLPSILPFLNLDLRLQHLVVDSLSYTFFLSVLLFSFFTPLLHHLVFIFSSERFTWLIPPPSSDHLA